MIIDSLKTCLLLVPALTLSRLFFLPKLDVLGDQQQFFSTFVLGLSTKRQDEGHKLFRPIDWVKWRPSNIFGVTANGPPAPIPIYQFSARLAGVFGLLAREEKNFRFGHGEGVPQEWVGTE